VILVTGGAGYIGSHTVKLLVECGLDVVVLDNLSRGHRESVPEGVPFELADLLDYPGMLKAIKKYTFDSVIHFAAFTYVGESVEDPGLYYRNNVLGSFNLINAVKECNIKKFVFSSTCSVYGNPQRIPISENEPANPINPYARTKLIIEDILRDYDTAHGMKHIALRYFNAAGCSDDASIGESHDPEPHLIPLIIYAAQGIKEKIWIYGDDYDTPDGTCIRDYIHVNDLADAHIQALDYMNKENKSDFINVGTGNGYSVKEMVDVARRITKREIKSEIIPRRAGDPARLVADNKKASDVLGWKPKYDLDGIIETAWKWYENRKF